MTTSPDIPLRWLTAEEAAAYLRYESPSAMYRAGLRSIACQRGTGRLLWHVDDLDAWMRRPASSSVHTARRCPPLPRSSPPGSSEYGHSARRCFSLDGRLHIHTSLPTGATLEDARAKRTLKDSVTRVRAPLPSTPSVNTPNCVSSCRYVVRLVRHLEALTTTRGAPYATATLRGWWRPVKVMFADAVADGLLVLNPCSRVDPPTTRVRHVNERQTLSAWELGRLVENARVVVPHRYAEIVTLAYTGMRGGELHGLTWEAVDLDGQQLEIRQAVSRGVLVDSTKTEAPRVVPIPDIVVEALRPLQRPSGLVFPSDAGTPRWISSIARPLLDAAEAYTGPWRPIGPRVTPQVLRRTFNTLLVAAGVDRIVGRSMMGHSSEESDGALFGRPHGRQTARDVARD